MKIICKNCQHTFEGNFCNNCGQTADTHRINFHFLWHDIQHSFLHFDKGIVYSFRQLFIRPGHSIREYIEGKRVDHFKPLSLLVVTATLYGFIVHYFHINLFNNVSSDLKIDFSRFNEWSTTHYSWTTVATIPLFTIGTYICFRKQGYNFVEYFVLNTFKASQRLAAHIITFPLVYYYNETPHSSQITNILYAFDIALIIWTNIQFFNRISFIKTFLLSILSHLICVTLFIIIIVIVLSIMGITI